MANICTWEMKVVGKNIGLLVNEILKYTPTMSAEFSSYRGTAYLEGECRWSVKSSELSKVLESYTDGSIEVFSEESGFGFQEHIVYRNGKLVKSECKDFARYDLSDYESAEDFYEQTGIVIDQNYMEKHSEYTTGGIAGYGDWTI